MVESPQQFQGGGALSVAESESGSMANTDGKALVNPEPDAEKREARGRRREGRDHGQRMDWTVDGETPWRRVSDSELRC